MYTNLSPNLYTLLTKKLRYFFLILEFFENFFKCLPYSLNKPKKCLPYNLNKPCLLFI